MGIKGLSKLIRKYAQDIDISSLHNKKVAIDTSIFLYKFKYNTKGNDFIKKFISQICSFREHQITPIYIFDGIPPIEKQITLDKRKNIKDKNMLNAANELDQYKKKTIEKNIIHITSDDKKNLQTLLGILNIQYIIPETEGEKYCSFLNKTGVVDAVISNDFDSLTFGCKSLITSEFKQYTLDMILTELNISSDHFIDICIASGTDYCPSGIPRIGPFKGLNYVKKYGSIENWIDITIPDNLNISVLRNIFKQDPIITSTTTIQENDINLEFFLSSLGLKINTETLKKLY